MQMNRVEVAGFLSKKPEIRYLPSGTPVANVRLGQSYRFQDGNKQWQERTNWHNLSFYGDLSAVALGFEKGENLYIEGAIEQRDATASRVIPQPGSSAVVGSHMGSGQPAAASAAQTSARRASRSTTLVGLTTTADLTCVGSPHWAMVET